MPVSQFGERPASKSSPSQADCFVETPPGEGSYTVTGPDESGKSSPGKAPAQSFNDTKHYEDRGSRGPVVLTRAKSGPNRRPSTVDTFKEVPDKR